MSENNAFLPTTIKVLREWLAEFPDDMPVIMSKDAEGNGYSPVVCVEERMYVPETAWYGEAYMTHEDIVAHADWGYTEEDEAPEGATRVVCVCPVN